MTYFRCASHGPPARSLIFSGNPVTLAGPPRTIPARCPMVSSPVSRSSSPPPERLRILPAASKTRGPSVQDRPTMVQRVPTPPGNGRPRPPTGCTGIFVLDFDQPDGTSLSRLRRAEKPACRGRTAWASGSQSSRMSSSRQRPRLCNDRTVARKWAVRKRPDKADRLILPLLELSGIAAVAASAAAVVGGRPDLSPRPSRLRPPRPARPWPRRSPRPRRRTTPGRSTVRSPPLCSPPGLSHREKNLADLPASHRIGKDRTGPSGTRPASTGQTWTEMVGSGKNSFICR